MYAGSHALWSVLQDYALRVPVQWLVRVLVLTSMTLQLILVVLGARRYLSSSRVLRLMVWGSYISADAVAISALGTMMHNARSMIYGIWAPLLLMHLGGPDAITAYSMADNELWLRHGFNMVYQVSVAVYVIYASALKGLALTSAILLLLVGFIKYGERTLALRFASYSRIVMSSLSISKYMEKENVVQNCRYVVMGEDQLQKKIEQEPAPSSQEGRGIEAESEESSLKRRGKEVESEASSLKRRGKEVESEASSQLQRNIEKKPAPSSQEGSGVGIFKADICCDFKIKDVCCGRRICCDFKIKDVCCERRSGVVTIKDVEVDGIEERDRDICISHALFKMYRRRFGSLPFVEGDWPQTRKFWLDLGGERAFRIVEMELKFMYDALFSKYSGPAFSNGGMVVRFLNTILIGAAGFLILRENQSRQAQGMVTYVVISAALVVEVFQLWRVIVSDWIRVRLICAIVVPRQRRIERQRRVGQQSSIERQSCIEWCGMKVIKMMGVVENRVGEKYWSNRIPQHCLIETWLNRFPLMWKVVGFFPKPDSFVSWYTALGHIREQSVQKNLKLFIFNILEDTCSQEDESETFREVGSQTFREKIYNFENHFLKEETEILNVLRKHRNLEETILMWHIATTLCDTERGGQTEISKDCKHATYEGTSERICYICLSMILSRYCAYLVLSRPYLLPLHPKMARIEYMQVVKQLLNTLTLNRILEKDPKDLLKYHGENVLGSGAELARYLLEKKQQEERWKLLSGYWGRLVIYMAVYNKATYHAECGAAGGEFLSHVWVLLGHMGCGEQSDFAVTKKIEMSSENEVALGKKPSREDSAVIEKKLRDCEKELAVMKNSDREKEFAEMKKLLREREKELDATKKDLLVQKKYYFNREEAV